MKIPLLNIGLVLDNWQFKIVSKCSQLLRDEKDHTEPSALMYWDHNNRGKASTTDYVQHSLQHLLLVLSQVSKVNRQSIHFIKNFTALKMALNTASVVYIYI